MRLRAGLEVLWRRRGETQVGTDPRCAVVVDGLTESEQRLLEHLRHAPSRADLLRLARTLHVAPERVDELVDLLQRAGVLAAGAEDRTPWRPKEVSPDEAYWERAHPTGDGRAVIDRRARATVAVLGLDRLGMLLATELAWAGIGTVLAEDDRPVGDGDVGPYGATDVGRSRRECAQAVLRRAVVGVRTTAPARSRPDVVVTVAAHVTDPVRMRPLMREDVPHLPVVVGEVATSVGPLVVPGEGPCTRCVDLHRTDADASWPAVATQLRVTRGPGAEAATAYLAAAVASHQVLAFVDGREVAARTASLEVDALDPRPAVRPWRPHPRCGCQGRQPLDTTSAPALATR